MTFKKIFSHLTLFALSLAIITWGFTLTVKIFEKCYVWPLLLLFMYAVNTTTLYLLYKSSLQKSIKFINVFMLTGFGKMLLYVAVMLIYVYLNPTLAVPFVIIFLFYFMAFLAFEVVLLQKMNKTTNS